MSNTIKFTCASLQPGKKGVVAKDDTGYYDMVIGGMNILNSKGEYYEYEAAKSLFENSSAFMRRVKRGALRGEVGHPRKQVGESVDAFLNRVLDICEPNVCVHYSEVYLDFENFKNPDGSKIVAIRAKLRPAGPKAQFLQEAIDNPKENVCFSIRSFTDNSYSHGRVNKVLKNIITFDYVNEPGIHIAEKYKSPSLEAVEETVFSKEQFDSAMDLRQVLHLSTESTILTKDELYASFGWTETPTNRYTSW